MIKIVKLKDPDKKIVMVIIHCKIFPPMQRKPLQRRIYSSPPLTKPSLLAVGVLIHFIIRKKSCPTGVSALR